MKQLFVFCEGQTEQRFCKETLRNHLFPNHDGMIHSLAVGAKNHHHVHGISRTSKYETLRKFIRNTLSSHDHKYYYFTTLIDLYGLPEDFPGKSKNTRNSAEPTHYVKALEEAFGKDINDRRFIPYLQLHEFETLLFADPEKFRTAIEGRDEAIEELKQIAGSFPSIEHINDGKTTAPSKRIVKLIPEYEGLKATAGPDIAEAIGLPVLRKKSPHFKQWISRLKSLDWGD